MKFLLLLFLFFIIINCSDIPNPNKDTTGCGDYKDVTTGYICDPSYYLKYEELKRYFYI